MAERQFTDDLRVGDYVRENGQLYVVESIEYDERGRPTVEAVEYDANPVKTGRWMVAAMVVTAALYLFFTR